VQETFHTAIHKFSIAGIDHWANSTDPQIPEALSPVVAGVATLHNFYKKPLSVQSKDSFPFTKTPGSAPQFTTANGIHAVGPGDLAVIYNANTLYFANTPIDGTGSTVAVVARSNFNMSDYVNFREEFTLPGLGLQIILNGPDPGNLHGGEEVEAILDASYAIALAPGAHENFVLSRGTNTSDGVDLSEAYIIDNNLGDVMTESFGGCEEGVTSAEATSISNLAQQAAAQGITYMVSTGDNGSAGCDNPENTLATQGVSVNVLASTPFTVAVGGTMFNDTLNPGLYWNSTNDSSSSSAKSYIPENVWNESCSVASCGSQNANLFAGSGGVSTLFPKPSWQSGVAGIPATGNRNLPDVSLTAAGHDPYLICLEGSCTQASLRGVAGTSASVQAFGGIMALVREKAGSRVGQADYVFYKLAANETLANCNASKTPGPPASNCIFNDVTVGNNAVPGIPGFGTPSGNYQSTVGYDRASGLGSVNVMNLVNQWSTATFAPSVTTLSVSPTSFTHGATANINITVAPMSGSPSFTNELVFLSTGGGQVIGDFTLANGGTFSESTNSLTGGSYSLTAHYPGNGTLGSSDSAPVPIVVAPETTTTVESVLNGGSGGAPATNVTYGTSLYLSAAVAGQSGVGAPTGIVNFTDTGGITVNTESLNSAGVGVPTALVSSLSIGSHSLTANYAGDASYKSSSSQASTITITQDATLTDAAAPPTMAFGSTAQFLATVTPRTNSLGNAPTGTITLNAGGTQLGSPAPVVAGGSTGTVSASALFSESIFPLGMTTFTATYSGDANYLGSTSNPETVNVLRTDTVMVTASPAAVQSGQSVAITVQIVPVQPGGPTPTGSVQFTLDQIFLSPNPVALTNAQAQFTANITGDPGTHIIEASYSGDGSYAGLRGTFTETINPGPDFSFSFNPTVVNVSSPGSSASTVMSLTGSNGFNSAISLSGVTCSNLPAESNCGFNPQTVAVGGSSTLTVFTKAPSTLFPANRPTSFNWKSVDAMFRLAVLCIGLLVLGIQVRRRRWNLAANLLVVALLVATAACGGGGGGGGGVGFTDPGTPKVQNVPVTVSVTSGTTTHQFTFTLNVN
ncbi:MAG: Ig-like domain repeat protein, partial [Candidatus Acidiferrales bacterium]